MTRVIRYNRSPESQRERSEAQKRRVLPPKVCEACDTPYTPSAANQRRCQDCKDAGRKLP